jgi:site-specific recombinase XerD
LAAIKSFVRWLASEAIIEDDNFEKNRHDQMAESWQASKSSFLPALEGIAKIGIRGRHCLRQTGEERTQTLVTRALLATAHAFGFRKRELLELSVRRVDSLNRSIRLNARATKSGDGRVVNMTQDVFILLQSCALGRAAEDFVFTQHDGNPVLASAGGI